MNSRSKNIFAGTSAGIARKMKENNYKFQLFKII
jgi:hypothetical protein